MTAKARILVVDDDATMREALRDTLGAEGYGVVAVEDAVINYLPVMHDAAMVNFASFLGRVTTTDELLDELTEGKDAE